MRNGNYKSFSDLSKLFKHCSDDRTNYLRTIWVLKLEKNTSIDSLKTGQALADVRAFYLYQLILQLLFITAIFGTTGLFLSYYMADKYYETNTITHAAEFPWAILLLTLAMITIFLACIMYLVITCKWYNYCHHFGCRRPWYMDEPDGGKAGIYTINRNSRRLRTSTRRDSPPASGYGAGIPSFTFNGISKKDSTYYEPMRSSSYSDFRATKSGKKYSSSGDLRHSPRTSLYDSPRILRASRMSDFIKDEQNFLRQSRKSGYGSGIDPAGLSVRSPLDKPIIRQSRSDMDILRDSRREPSVLDILYRESRKSKY